MADLDQNVSALNKVQRWKEFVTGVYARLNGAILYALSTSSTEMPLLCSTAGNLHAELQGSTEAIGQIGGHTVHVSVNLAPTTSGAYTAGDLMGAAALSLASVFRSTAAMTGILESITLADKTTQQGSFDFVLFATVTTGTTFTNDSAFTLADGDLGKVLGAVSLVQSDYSAFADNGVATVRGIGLPVKATTGTGLTAAAVLRSAPTYVTSGDLVATFGFLVD